ncbi:protein kinase [Streptomyces sp. NPDC048442]|uniref:protein kinase domain-containing protein n=1 Tax=Streptomyces sp. NPDC048442 TaxID=3154823 RepID=UPI0034241B8B
MLLSWSQQVLRRRTGMPGYTSGGVQGLLIAGRYRLGETIGQGGMGRVWRAYDEILDRAVAVKEMRMDGLDAEDSRIRRERTLREARATARIDHPNVVRVYDVADESDRLWIVMELVDSRSLEQHLVGEGPVPPREAARIGLGVTAALREVHVRGVLHRDIKPGNVLLGRGNDRVVLTDFGIAAIQNTTALTIVGMLVGSPDYMAPERVGGRPQGAPSDLWSLGATLCAAVGGTSPFTRPTTMATLHAVLYEEPELPASAGELAPILTALLAKEPEARPTVDELHAALTELLAGEGERAGEAERAEGPSEPEGPVQERTRPVPPVPYEPTRVESPVPVPVQEPLAGAEGPGVEPSGEGAGPRRSETTELRVPAGAVVPEQAQKPEAAADPETGTGAPQRSGGRGVRFRRSRPGPRTDPRVGTVEAARGTSGPVTGPVTGPGTLEDAVPRTRRPTFVVPPVTQPGEENPAPSPDASALAPGPAPVPVQAPAPATAPEPEPVEPVPAPEAAPEPVPEPEPAPAPAPAPEPPLEPPLEPPAPAPEPPISPAPGRTLPRTRTRPRALVAAGAAVLVAGAVVTAVLLGRGEDPGQNNNSSGNNSSASSSTSKPSVAPTVAGTARPPTSGVRPGSRNEIGFSWVPPTGWTRSARSPSNVHYHSPDGTQEIAAAYTLVRGGDLLTQWENFEKESHDVQDYRKIRLERTTFQGRPAVVWEYTFTQEGKPRQGRQTGFNAGGKSYQINVWFEIPARAEAFRNYERVTESFVPL